jgi:hypothetical protein
VPQHALHRPDVRPGAGQLSFAYYTLEEAPVTLPGGVKANELRRLRLYEVSLVPVGTNQDTGVVP